MIVTAPAPPQPSDSAAVVSERPVDPVDRWLLLATLIVCYTLACGLVLSDPDLWGHVLYGIRALDQGVVCERTDPFSYTALGAKWVNHEWLTEIQLGWLWSHYGNFSLFLWRNFFVMLIFICTAAEIHRQKATLAAGIVLLVYGAECLSQFVVFVRPQVPTFAFFAFTLLVLKRHAERQARGAIWLLPPLQAIWVNMHGGFLAGLGVIGIHAVMEMLEPLVSRRPYTWRNLEIAAVLMASVGATLFNPYGPELYLMLWEHLSTDQLVMEWQPLWAAQQLPTYYVPLILLAISLPFSHRWSYRDLAVLAIVTYQGFSHIRHVALLAIACLVLLPGPLSESLPRLFPHLTGVLSQPGKRGWKILGAFSILAVLVLLEIRGAADLWTQGLPPWEVAVETRSNVPGMPVRALKFLKAVKVSGNLLTDYGWAQFVMWHSPELKVAFDGRYRTVYSGQLEAEFLAFMKSGKELPPKTPFLDVYPTEIVLLPVRSTPVAYLRQRADWAQLYQDSQAVIFVPRISRFQALLKRKQKDELPIVDTPVWQRFPAEMDLPN